MSIYLEYPENPNFDKNIVWILDSRIKIDKNHQIQSFPMVFICFDSKNDDISSKIIFMWIPMSCTSQSPPKWIKLCENMIQISFFDIRNDGYRWKPWLSMVFIVFYPENVHTSNILTLFIPRRNLRPKIESHHIIFYIHIKYNKNHNSRCEINILSKFKTHITDIHSHMCTQ